MKRLAFVFLFLIIAAPIAAQTVVTQVGAIYATGSKLLLRIYIPSVSDSEIDQQAVLPGESLLKMPIATFKTGGISAVQAVVGAPTISGRCAVVSKTTNKVLSVIICDPALYTDPDGNNIILHALAQVGDTWTGTVFTRRYVEINPHAATALTAIVTTSIQNIAIAAPVTASNVLMVSPTLNVGSAIPAALFLKLKSQP